MENHPMNHNIVSNVQRLLATLLCALTTMATTPGRAQTTAPAGQVNLIFVGDLLLDDGPGRTIAAGGDPLAAFADLLSQADYRIGNLECPIADAATGQALDNKIFSFKADPRVTRVLKGRFDALAVSNNHSGDFGTQAFLETLDHVKAAGITTFGGGKNLSVAHAPLWIHRNGLKIAVLGYNEFKPRSFEATASRPGIAWSEDSQVLSDIRAARKAGADLIIPFMHWGWERELYPSARQQQLARTMIDAGADVVVGGHPHVTQGAEYYKGKLIVYSLGNFVFDGFELADGKIGWLLRLTLDKKGLVRWDTRMARMDEAGTPHPDATDRTPCGSAGDQQPRLCRNGPF
jgi:poly-gamma-glutamate synthesis protein (capsule biosynthesis protein)